MIAHHAQHAHHAQPYVKNNKVYNSLIINDSNFHNHNCAAAHGAHGAHGAENAHEEISVKGRAPTTDS